MTEAEFTDWEARQPLRFEIVDGSPARLPEADQAPSRLARVRTVAERVLGSREAAVTWMTSGYQATGGLEPEVLAAESEEGCQLVLRALVVMGRQQEATHG